MKKLSIILLLAVGYVAHAQTPQNNDQRITNAGVAKAPKGKMSLTVDGKILTIPENKVQAMYVGMNTGMAQAVITGGNQVSINHMGVPKLGEVKSKGRIPSVTLSVNINGTMYMNGMSGGEAHLSITKVKPDGKNYYVSGTFSGTLLSPDGKKSITVSNGKFESGYL